MLSSRLPIIAIVHISEYKSTVAAAAAVAAVAAAAAAAAYPFVGSRSILSIRNERIMCSSAAIVVYCLVNSWVLTTELTLVVSRVLRRMFYLLYKFFACMFIFPVQNKYVFIHYVQNAAPHKYYCVLQRTLLSAEISRNSLRVQWSLNYSATCLNAR